MCAIEAYRQSGSMRESSDVREPACDEEVGDESGQPRRHLAVLGFDGICPGVSEQLDQVPAPSEAGTVGPCLNETRKLERGQRPSRPSRSIGFEVLELHRVFAEHLVRNPASGRVMQKVGMRHEARLRQHINKWGAFEDIDLYGILADEWRQLNAAAGDDR